MSLKALTLAIPLLLLSAPAHAGWVAKQKMSAPFGPPQEATLYFEGEHLRMEPPGPRAVVINLKTGRFMFIDKTQKQYTEAHVDDLLKLRDDELQKAKAAAEQKIQSLPPERQAQARQMLKAMEDATKPLTGVKIQSTGKKDKVGKYACKILNWESPRGSTEACVASKLPIDLGPFKKVAAKMGKKLAGLTGGGGELLLVADRGFPVRVKNTFRMGPRTMEITTETTDIKRQKVQKSLFAKPASFKKIPLEMMLRSQAPGPGPKR